MKARKEHCEQDVQNTEIGPRVTLRDVSKPNQQPDQVHYTFNLRDFSKVISGVGALHCHDRTGPGGLRMAW